jgi:hypothetical protein
MNDVRDLFHDGLARFLQPGHGSRKRSDRGGFLPLGDEAETRSSGKLTSGRFPVNLQFSQDPPAGTPKSPRDYPAASELRALHLNPEINAPSVDNSSSID